jgi:hypothetical protein
VIVALAPSLCLFDKHIRHFPDTKRPNPTFSSAATQTPDSRLITLLCGWYRPLCHSHRDLLLAAFDFALREVVVATVHGLEFAPVDGNAGLRQRAHLAAQLDEPRTNLLMAGPLSLGKSAMVL